MSSIKHSEAEKFAADFEWLCDEYDGFAHVLEPLAKNYERLSEQYVKANLQKRAARASPMELNIGNYERFIKEEDDES